MSVERFKDALVDYIRHKYGPETGDRDKEQTLSFIKNHIYDNYLNQDENGAKPAFFHAVDEHARMAGQRTDSEKVSNAPIIVAEFVGGGFDKLNLLNDTLKTSLEESRVDERVLSETSQGGGPARIKSKKKKSKRRKRKSKRKKSKKRSYKRKYKNK